MVLCNSTRSKQPLANDFTPGSSPEARLSLPMGETFEKPTFGPQVG